MYQHSPLAMPFNSPQGNGGQMPQYNPSMYNQVGDLRDWMQRSMVGEMDMSNLDPALAMLLKGLLGGTLEQGNYSGNTY